MLLREELLADQLTGELRRTLRRMDVAASILGKLYIQAISLCGLRDRLILTHRYDLEARLTSTYRIRDAGDLWVMEEDLICSIKAPKITYTAYCGLDAALDVDRISVRFRNHWASRHFTGAHNIYSTAASLHPTSTHKNDCSYIRKVSISISTNGIIANSRSMNKDEETNNAVVTDMVNSAMDEVVKHAITTVASDVICNVVDIMVEGNSTITELKKTLNKDLMTRMDARVEALVDEHVNKSLQAARTKAALQAELEMVSFVLSLRDRSTTDLHPGRKDLQR